MKSNIQESVVMQTQNFTIVVRPENTQRGVLYVAECVEYDICVQGSTVAQVKERFLKTIWGHIIIALENGLTPFACLAPGYASAVVASSVTDAFSATLPRQHLPKQLEDKWDAIPRGVATLQFA